MQSLEDRILGYIYFLNMKYFVDSISLSKLCYKMQRSVRAVKPDADILVAKGFLKAYHQEGGVSYAISKEGIDHVEHKGLLRLRDLVVVEPGNLDPENQFYDTA